MRLLRLTLVFLAPVLISCALRFPDLALRPMHCDEAVNADKFGTLLEKGRYEYNPVEFHGPTLYYMTLVPAWLRGQARYTSLDETTLRSLPASVGVALVAAHILLVPFLGLAGAMAAAVLAAISPAMVYYSRYYIHETLLVFFSFGALVSACRYVLKPRAHWAVLTGACLGLMYATKETAVIVFASILLALLSSLVLEKRLGISPPKLGTIARPSHLVLGLASGLLIWGLFYSSFLTNWKGLVDSIYTCGFYFRRGTSASLHMHPWHYYLRMLVYWRARGGPVWSEGLILILAVPAFVAAWTRTGITGIHPRLLRFLAFYSLFMIFFYSVIPHKTPWCLLGFLHGLILLAGAGTVWILNVLRKPAARISLCAVMFLAAGQLGWQAWAASFRYDADPRNPYVYAHTGKDIFLIARRIADLARAHPLGAAMPIQVISRENLWPLPWYLRGYSAVQWWTGVSDRAPNAPLVIATPDMESALIRKFYELPPPGQRDLYMNVFDRRVELRPQVELRGYAVKWLWDDYRRLEAYSAVPSRPES